MCVEDELAVDGVAHVALEGSQGFLLRLALGELAVEVGAPFRVAMADLADGGEVDAVVLLSLDGLRVSEACGANIEDLAVQRGHRTLAIVGMGNRPAVIPLVPRTARTLDLVIGERHEEPILC